ncbi:hypothetical protein [Nocardioides sp. WS12]|uniref:hypothetical protein n=1 Tax=Nocardioides sp. WS12 TaxID=2486272 RepID=UPI0015FBC996|nr:hypothetical protein [Nocardioides sp. WS12]
MSEDQRAADVYAASIFKLGGPPWWSWLDAFLFFLPDLLEEAMTDRFTVVVTRRGSGGTVGVASAARRRTIAAKLAQVRTDLDHMSPAGFSTKYDLAEID